MIRVLLEEAKIGERAGELEVGVSGGGQGEVNAEEAGGEHEEDGDGDGEFPRVQREPLRFGLLRGGRIIVLALLFVPRRRHIPRRRHRTIQSTKSHGGCGISVWGWVIESKSSRNWGCFIW